LGLDERDRVAELEAAPAAKTAFYGKPPARKRERMARGLDITSW
jgi:hypothetical protein